VFSQSWYGTAPASDKCAVAALERTACKRAHKILAKKRQAEGNEEHKILGREEKRREEQRKKRREEKRRGEKGAQASWQVSASAHQALQKGD
jgi:hypothetical protein